MRALTEEVPDEYILEETWGLEPMLEHLFQCPDQPKLSTQEQGETAPLRARGRETERREKEKWA